VWIALKEVAVKKLLILIMAVFLALFIVSAITAEPAGPPVDVVSFDATAGNSLFAVQRDRTDVMLAGADSATLVALATILTVTAFVSAVILVLSDNYINLLRDGNIGYHARDQTVATG
jgi:hypothetical protein